MNFKDLKDTANAAYQEVKPLLIKGGESVNQTISSAVNSDAGKKLTKFGEKAVCTMKKHPEKTAAGLLVLGAGIYFLCRKKQEPKNINITLHIHNDGQGADSKKEMQFKV